MAVVLLAAGAGAVAPTNGLASGGSQPSATAAKRATRAELILRYGVLDAHATHHPVTLKIGCGRVAKLRYRCSFFGTTTDSNLWVFVLSGSATVRFGPSGARTTIHPVACNTYSLGDVKYDLC